MCIRDSFRVFASRLLCRRRRCRPPDVAPRSLDRNWAVPRRPSCRGGAPAGWRLRASHPREVKRPTSVVLSTRQTQCSAALANLRMLLPCKESL
eukprot:15204678-Alexandrium_andersonii.AAC.1